MEPSSAPPRPTVPLRLAAGVVGTRGWRREVIQKSTLVVNPSAPGRCARYSRLRNGTPVFPCRLATCSHCAAPQVRARGHENDWQHREPPRAFTLQTNNDGEHGRVRTPAPRSSTRLHPLILPGASMLARASDHQEPLHERTEPFLRPLGAKPISHTKQIVLNWLNHLCSRGSGTGRLICSLGCCFGSPHVPTSERRPSGMRYRIWLNLVRRRVGRANECALVSILMM